MKKVIFILVIIVLLILGLMAAVYALTYTPEVAIPKTYLNEVRGSIFYQKADEEN